MQKLTKKQRDARIDAIISNSVTGWQIPMTKIPEIYRAGVAVAVTPDGAIDEAAIRAAVTAKLEAVAVRA